MGRKFTQEELICYFNNKHKFFYDYSKMKYTGALNPIEVVCPTHGSFFIIANNHKLGFGCALCRKADRLKKVIEEFNIIHVNKYNYGLVDYKGENSRVKIICPVHGEFLKLPISHRKGSGCYQCAIDSIAVEELILRFVAIHGKRYDYRKVVLGKSTDKIIIVCAEHGEFKQNAYKHLDYQGCPMCAGTLKKNNQQVIAEFQGIYGDRFDYSKLEYNGNAKKVIITCKSHGDFLQTPKSHRLRVGCSECQVTNKTVADEINSFRLKHGGTYDYSMCSKELYINQKQKISIKCNIHGLFDQSIASHKSGSGCPQCSRMNKTRCRSINFGNNLN